MNLRSGRILPDNQPPSPEKEVEEKREENNLKENPPFPERLAQPHQPTQEETKILGEKESGVQTRRTIVGSSSYLGFLSTTEPQNVNQASK